MLAFAVARLWQNVLSNAVTPGRVRTKMGGAGAPDDISQAHLTQAWLATSDDPSETTGGYFYHLKRREPNPEARDIAVQDRLIDICQEISGVNCHGAEEEGRTGTAGPPSSRRSARALNWAAS